MSGGTPESPGVSQRRWRCVGSDVVRLKISFHHQRACLHLLITGGWNASSCLRVGDSNKNFVIDILSACFSILQVKTLDSFSPAASIQAATRKRGNNHARGAQDKKQEPDRQGQGDHKTVGLHSTSLSSCLTSENLGGFSFFFFFFVSHWPLPDSKSLSLLSGPQSHNFRSYW